jgi:hypothetical protein
MVITNLALVVVAAAIIIFAILFLFMLMQEDFAAYWLAFEVIGFRHLICV